MPRFSCLKVCNKGETCPQVRLSYRIGMGVRGADQNWKRQLNRLIQENQAEINRILIAFGVPLLDEKDQPITAEIAESKAMKLRLASLLLGGLLLGGLLLAQTPANAEGVPEPEGYRGENYRSPTPATLRGARVLSTEDAEAIWKSRNAIFVDVLPHAPRPANLPPGTIWREKPRRNIPGSVWLPDTGYGALAAETENYLRTISRA